jgi:hypothetical protein
MESLSINVNGEYIDAEQLSESTAQELHEQTQTYDGYWLKASADGESVYAPMEEDFEIRKDHNDMLLLATNSLGLVEGMWTTMKYKKYDGYDVGFFCEKVEIVENKDE